MTLIPFSLVCFLFFFLNPESTIYRTSLKINKERKRIKLKDTAYLGFERHCHVYAEALGRPTAAGGAGPRRLPTIAAPWPSAGLLATYTGDSPGWKLTKHLI